jgi:hypothetical protein
MASSAEIILNSFLNIAGEDWTGVGVSALLRNLVAASAGSSGNTGTSGGGLGDALGQVLSGALGGSVAGAAVTAASSGSTGSSTPGRVASAVFGSALGMAPLAKAIVGLFTGGSKEAEQPLVKYALPAHLQFEAADGPGPVMVGVDYGQNGLARSQDPAGANSGGTAAASAQITVQVNAMDSRSFLDHKDDIARAVRQAMLNMHSLNDVVSDL